MRSFLFWSLVFGVCYTQAPLYYSNQNQYFLHGMAEAGVGDLRHDWLANTKDPTPLFSGLVAVTVGYLHESLFYVYYLLIIGLYFHCLYGIFTYLTDGNASAAARYGFIALLIVFHAGIIRWGSAQLFGVDYPWFFQAGIAGQYLLGFALQPSVFGVFLLASILAFLRDRPWLAVVWACLAATLHATYFPTAALLTLAYMLVNLRTRCLRRAILLGIFALLLVSPALIYNAVTFSPTSPEVFKRAQSLLAHERIPHHCEFRRWLDIIAVLQIGWMILGIALARRGELLVILSVLFAGSALFTYIEWLTESDFLALLFPWRTSVVLVPIATTVMLTRFIQGIGMLTRLIDPAARFTTAAGGVILAASGLIIAACFVGGLAVPMYELGYRSNPDELRLLEFVQKNHKPGEVYLIPVETLKPWTENSKRGVFNSNFVPPTRRGKDGQFIAIDLQRFRTFTGAALYVDFKSIPYKDEEVVEWWRRVRRYFGLYDKGPSGSKTRNELIGEGITHVIVPAKERWGSEFASVGPSVYDNGIYLVFAIQK